MIYIVYKYVVRLIYWEFV